MVLSTGVGGAIQMGLLLIAASITATTIDPEDRTPAARACSRSRSSPR